MPAISSRFNGTMKRRLPLSGAGVLGLAILLAGCQPSTDLTKKGPLDDQLETLIGQASSGQGKAFYVLPESTDYTRIPQDPKNPVTAEKVALGELLFHETALSQHPMKVISFGTYSCASCHHAKAGFQACVPQGIGDGGVGFGQNGEARAINSQYQGSDVDVQPVRSPSALNIAYQTNILWNGQFGATGVNTGTEAAWTKGTPKEKNTLGFQGVETQAIAGQDVHRLNMKASAFQGNATYKELFKKAFNDNWTNDAQTAINAGMAIAAYERTLLSTRAPFQRWLKGEAGALSSDEKEGAILFFGKAGCAQCHNGPALNAMKFYALGMNDLTNGAPSGNTVVVQADPAKAEHKGRGGFTGRAEDMYKFKVPQLYNLKDSPFYGHGASFRTIDEVIAYKNTAVAQNANVPKTQLAAEFKPLNLSTAEIQKLVSFIRNGLYDPELMRYVPKALPSGAAFPNNDPVSRSQLGF